MAVNEPSPKGTARGQGSFIRRISFSGRIGTCTEKARVVYNFLN